MTAHIVIIEDEEDILELEEYHLEKEGFLVTGFLSTKKVLDFLDEEEVHLLIVDRNLPGVEGSEFVKEIRELGYQIPVIFVSAKVSDEDIESGFESGGDDYLTKPFNPKELVLRVKSILKRTYKTTDKKVKYKDITLDTTDRKVFIDGSEVTLSRLEFELLLYFIKNPIRVITRDELLENIWHHDENTQEKTVNVAINRLLKKIDPTKKKNYIEPIRGVGYKLL
jgi:DNA-binding response OmpR family regulator